MRIFGKRSKIGYMKEKKAARKMEMMERSLIECIKEVDVSSREFSALILMKFHAFKVGIWE